MIYRNLIIPALITGGAHAAFFLMPGNTPPTLPAVVTTAVDVTAFKPPEQPEIPVDLTVPQEDLEQIVNNLRPPPMLPDTIVTVTDKSAFTTPFEPEMALPQAGNMNMMSVGPGDYSKGLKEGVGRIPIYSLKDLENKPKTVLQTAPEYPHGPKVRGEAGLVTVTFTVDENGDVRDVNVVDASNNEFVEPTIRAVSKWRFEPGRRQGKRVSFRMSVPVAFRLDDEN